jgi:hypothetical protein
VSIDATGLIAIDFFGHGFYVTFDPENAKALGMNLVELAQTSARKRHRRAGPASSARLLGRYEAN